MTLPKLYVPQSALRPASKASPMLRTFLLTEQISFFNFWHANISKNNPEFFFLNSKIKEIPILN